MKTVTRTLARQAPLVLCRLLSPYTSSASAASQLDDLLNKPELLDLLVECANRHMVIATLYAQLRQHDLLEHLPKDLLDYMQTMHELQQARNQRMASQARFIVTILNQGGITPLLMKGGDTLFYDLYPSQGSRFMSDLDILLPPGTVAAGRELLLEQGYAVPEKYRDILPARNPHHDIPLYRPGDDCGIELHYKPLNFRAVGLFPAEVAFRDSHSVERLEISGLQASSLSATHKVLYGFAHSEISHGFRKSDLLDIRQMDYFVRLVHYYGSAIDWKSMQLECADYGFQEELAVYCSKAARLFGLPPGEEFPVPAESAPALLEQRYQAAIQSAMGWYHPWWRFKKGVVHLLGMYGRERLAAIYELDNDMQYFWAIIKRSRDHLKRFWASPRSFLHQLRRVFVSNMF